MNTIFQTNETLRFLYSNLDTAGRLRLYWALKEDIKAHDDGNDHELDLMAAHNAVNVLVDVMHERGEFSTV